MSAHKTAVSCAALKRPKMRFGGSTPCIQVKLHLLPFHLHRKKVTSPISRIIYSKTVKNVSQREFSPTKIQFWHLGIKAACKSYALEIPIQNGSDTWEIPFFRFFNILFRYMWVLSIEAGKIWHFNRMFSSQYFFSSQFAKTFFYDQFEIQFEPEKY